MYFVENSKHLKILMSEKGDINFQKQVFTIIYQQLGISSLAAEYKGLNIREDYFVFAINGSIGLLQHWFKNDMNRSAKDMAEIIYNMTSQSGKLE